MKKLLILLFVFAPLLLSAQKSAMFYLQEDGRFKTEDRKDYVVLEYDSLSANKLYTNVKANINKIYKSPKKVLSEVENVSISIRGYSDILASDKLPLCSRSVYSGFYNLLFHFKDGRIKVDAPIIDEYLFEGIYKREFKSIISGFFKKGKLNPKKEKYLKVTESQLNLIINNILSFSSTDNEESW